MWAQPCSSVRAERFPWSRLGRLVVLEQGAEHCLPWCRLLERLLTFLSRGLRALPRLDFICSRAGCALGWAEMGGEGISWCVLGNICLIGQPWHEVLAERSRGSAAVQSCGLSLPWHHAVPRSPAEPGAGGRPTLQHTLPIVTTWIPEPPNVTTRIHFLLCV